MPVSRPYNPNAQRVAELIQADWAAIGVTANIVSYEWTEYREARQGPEGRKGPFQIGWTGDNGDPDNFFATLFSCSAIGVSNYSRWCNEDFDDLIQKAKVTADRQSARSSTNRPRSSSRRRARPDRSLTPRSSCR
jgi:dipeptide transport system substrate-binding protein